VEGLEVPDPADSADATGFELVIGLRRPNNPAPNPDALRAQGFDLLGTLKPNPQDGLADFGRPPRAEPGRRPAIDPQPQPDSRAARFSS
jgi:hypothetical protein